MATTLSLTRLDPRTRVLLAVAFAVPVALLHAPAAAATALILGLALLPSCGLGAAEVRKRLLAVNIFVLMLAVVLPFSTPGDVVTALGPLTITRQGLRLTLLVALKANAIVAAFTALVGPLPVADVGRALSWLRLPPTLVQTLLFTHRYLHLLGDEYRRMALAARARGFAPRNTLHTYHTYANLLGMVLVRGLERAERVQRAMRCRGFDGRFPLLAQSRFAVQDAVWSLGMLAVLAGIVLLEAR